MRSRLNRKGTYKQMRPEGPTFWLLNGQTDWGQDRRMNRRLYQTDGIAVGPVSGLRLAASPTGPLALDAPDGSLGGLVLPRGMAFDAENRLYLLSQLEPIIKRFEPSSAQFETLPTVGGQGGEARQFHEPANIAIVGHDLYVADRGAGQDDGRVQVFSLKSLALKYIWHRPDWQPIDIAAQGGAAYILDGQHGRVYYHQAGIDRLWLIIDQKDKPWPKTATTWQRIIVDPAGRIYLLNAAENGDKSLDVFQPALDPSQGDPCTASPICSTGPAWQYVETIQDAGDVRDRFDPPAIRLFLNCFCLPASLARPANRQMPAVPPTPEMPLGLCPPWSSAGLLFDREGNPATANPAASPGPKVYRTCGLWISPALDSQIYDCQWHRIEMTLTDLPPGTQVIVSTFTSADPRLDSEIKGLADELWDTKYTVTGRMQDQPDAGQDRQPEHEFLIQSREGQYLWLRVKLGSDGYATPTVQSMRVYYPRQSYLDLLPAVYAADDESRRFMEQFLSLFQTEWDALEAQIETSARYFDPAAVPEGPFMQYLADWLALPLEGSWDWDEKRNLLEAAPQIYSQRGTLSNLRRYLQVYLISLTGLEAAKQYDFPQIIEGFRERQHLMLSTDDQGHIGPGTSLWGPGVVSRLQLDVFAQVNEVRLVSTGDPERDLFHVYAHRFRVFIPAAWVRTKDDELMFRRALDAEKPAHTQYDLCLVEPRFRVGIQSTVGLDTIIGPYPVARLANPDEADPNKTVFPPGLPPQHRLGYDTILAGDPQAETGLTLSPGARIGLDTVLT